MNYQFYEILAFFFFYAFVGWCTEVIYATTNTGKFVNRGFLNGPVCPIYGAGAVLVIVCLTPLQDNLLVLYIGSVVLTSAIEFLTGFVLEKIFHQKWWDYTKDPFNVMGYVCLKFSLLWGLGCVFVMRIVQPPVVAVITKTPVTLRNLLLIIFSVTIAADCGITVAALAKIGNRLRLANDLDKLLNKVSEAVGVRLTGMTVKGMSEKEKLDGRLADEKELLEEKLAGGKEAIEGKLSGGKELISEKVEAGKIKLEHLEEQRKNLAKRYEELLGKAKRRYGDDYEAKAEKLSFVHKRLNRAYPNLNMAGFSELSERIKKAAALHGGKPEQEDKK